MLIVTGFIQLAPSDVAAFMTDLADLAVSTRRRDACLLYAAAVEDARIGRRLVVERWRDEAALTAHIQSDAAAAFIDRWQGRMSSDVHRYDVSAATPLSIE